MKCPGNETARNQIARTLLEQLTFELISQLKNWIQAINPGYISKLILLTLPLPSKNKLPLIKGSKSRSIASQDFADQTQFHPSLL